MKAHARTALAAVIATMLLCPPLLGVDAQGIGAGRFDMLGVGAHRGLLPCRPGIGVCVARAAARLVARSDERCLPPADPSFESVEPISIARSHAALDKSGDEFARTEPHPDPPRLAQRA